VSSLTDTVPPKETNPDATIVGMTPPSAGPDPEPSALEPGPTEPGPTGPVDRKERQARKPAARKPTVDRSRVRTRRVEAPDTDVPAGQAALAAVRVVLATEDDRRFLDRIVRLKNPPDEPAEVAVAVAFAVLGLSTDTRAALTSLRTLHSADPVTIGVNLGRASHSHLAEMHRVASALLDAEPSPLPGDDRAIPVVARDLVELTDAALARAVILDRIRA
jgi:hypothetical protein